MFPQLVFITSSLPLLLLCIGMSSSLSSPTMPLLTRDNNDDSIVSKIDNSREGTVHGSQSVRAALSDYVLRTEEIVRKYLPLLKFTAPYDDVTSSSDVTQIDDQGRALLPDQDRKPLFEPAVGREAAAESIHKRQFGTVLNGGYKIGKRNADGLGETQASIISMLEELNRLNAELQQGIGKRQFGTVLNGGYKIGKRNADGLGETHASIMSMMKELSTLLNAELQQGIGKRQFGTVLNSGYKIGKRNGNGLGEAEASIMSMMKELLALLNAGLQQGRLIGKRQFGTVLSGGYKLGKRIGDDRSEFQTRVMSMLKELVALLNLERQHTFSSVPVAASQSLYDEDAEQVMERVTQKRQFGRVLGGGHKMGKREVFEPDMNRIDTRLTPRYPAHRFSEEMPQGGHARMTATQHVPLFQPNPPLSSVDLSIFLPSHRIQLIKDILERLKAYVYLSEVDFPRGVRSCGSSSSGGYPDSRKEDTDGWSTRQIDSDPFARHDWTTQTTLHHLPSASGFLPSSSLPTLNPAFPTTIDRYTENDERLSLPGSQNDHMVSVLNRVRNIDERTPQYMKANAEELGPELFAGIPDERMEKPSEGEWTISSEAEIRQPRGADHVPGNGFGIGKRVRGSFPAESLQLHKRWFFNIPFPGGYKLGKRSQEQRTKRSVWKEDARKVKAMREDQSSVTDSGHQHMTKPTAATGFPGREKRLIWRNPYWYRLKRSVNKRGAGLSDSYESVDSPSYIDDARGVRSNVIFPRRYQLKHRRSKREATKKSFVQQSTHHPRSRINASLGQPVKGYRNFPSRSQLYSRYPPAPLSNGLFSHSRFWPPLFLTQFGKRRQSSDSAQSVDMKPAQSSLSEMARSNLGAEKRFLWKAFEDDALDKGGDGRNNEEHDRLEKTPNSENLDRLAESLVYRSDRGLAKRFFWRVLGGYKLGKRGKAAGGEPSELTPSFRKGLMHLVLKLSGNDSVRRFSKALTDGSIHSGLENQNQNDSWNNIRGYQESDRKSGVPVLLSSRLTKRTYWNLLGSCCPFLSWFGISKGIYPYRSIKRDSPKNAHGYDMTQIPNTHSVNTDRNGQRTGRSFGQSKKLGRNLYGGFTPEKLEIDHWVTAKTTGESDATGSKNLSHNSSVGSPTLEKVLGSASHGSQTDDGDLKDSNERGHRQRRAVFFLVPGDSHPDMKSGQSDSDTDLTKRPWVKVLGKLKRRSFKHTRNSPYIQRWASNTGLMKRFWGKMIGGYRIAGKR